MERTYKQAVTIMVDWWAEKMQKPLNQNNGDNSESGGIAFMLMNMVAMNAQETITEDKIKKFKSFLTDKLIPLEGNNNWRGQLDVDYHPNELLFQACEYSGINTSALPCKTFTRIEDNFVIGRYQYGGEFFKL